MPEFSASADSSALHAPSAPADSPARLDASALLDPSAQNDHSARLGSSTPNAHPARLGLSAPDDASSPSFSPSPAASALPEFSATTYPSHLPLPGGAQARYSGDIWAADALTGVILTKESRTEKIRTGGIRSVRIQAGEIRVGEILTEESRAEESRTEASRAGGIRAQGSRGDEIRTGEIRSEEIRIVDTRCSETSREAAAHTDPSSDASSKGSSTSETGGAAEFIQYRVLIVDDDVDWAQTACLALEAEGIEARAIHTAHEALALLHAEEFHAAVIDVLMPDRWGVELVYELRQSLGDSLPIIIATGALSADGVAAGLLAGADDELFKIDAKSELIPKLKRLWSRNQSRRQEESDE